MELDKITDAEMDAQGVIAAPDILEGAPSDVKAIFDRMVRQVVAIAVNQVIDEINAHEVDTQNPHSASQEQVGLGSVDNTADADKPVSTEQAAALALKADKTNVLEKDNTTAFIPTADYQPAPKKYVDDTASAVVLGQIPDGSLTMQKLSDGAVTPEKMSDAAKAWDTITEKPSSYPPSTHADRHKTSGDDALMPADIDAATKPSIITVTFATASWTLNATSNCYEQTVACAGLLAADSYNIDVVPVGSTDAAAQALTDAAYAVMAGPGGRMACNADGQLYARCPAGAAAPTTNFQVAVVISR